MARTSSACQLCVQLSGARHLFEKSLLDYTAGHGCRHEVTFQVKRRYRKRTFRGKNGENAASAFAAFADLAATAHPTEDLVTPRHGFLPALPECTHEGIIEPTVEKWLALVAAALALENTTLKVKIYQQEDLLSKTETELLLMEDRLSQKEAEIRLMITEMTEKQNETALFSREVSRLHQRVEVLAPALSALDATLLELKASPSTASLAAAFPDPSLMVRALAGLACVRMSPRVEITTAELNAVTAASMVFRDRGTRIVQAVTCSGCGLVTATVALPCSHLTCAKCATLGRCPVCRRTADNGIFLRSLAELCKDSP